MNAALANIATDQLLHEKMKNWLLSQGGTAEEADQILQEALGLLERNLRLGKFKVLSALGAYYFGIIRSCWLDWCRRRKSSNGEIDMS